MAKQKKIEIARSFSRKLSTGNYENVDIFCSAKAEVEYEEMDIISGELYEFCKKEVEKSINSYKIKDFENDGSKELLERIKPPLLNYIEKETSFGKPTPEENRIQQDQLEEIKKEIEEKEI